MMTFPHPQLLQLQLQKGIHKLLPLAIQSPDLQKRVLLALEAPGKIYDRAENSSIAGFWAITCVFLGHYFMASSNPDAEEVQRLHYIALALECHIAAFDQLDDIQDGEKSRLEEEIGLSQTLTVTMALQFLSSYLLLNAPASTFEQTTTLMSLLTFESLNSIAGQYMDLDSEGIPLSQRILSEAERDYFVMIELKSGSLARLLFRMAAHSAGRVDDKFLKVCDRLSIVLGLAQQIQNDCIGFMHQNDLERGKQTLPIILLQSFPDKETVLKAAYARVFWLQRRARAYLSELEELIGQPCPAILLKLLNFSILDNEE